MVVKEKKEIYLFKRELVETCHFSVTLEFSKVKMIRKHQYEILISSFYSLLLRLKIGTIPACFKVFDEDYFGWLMVALLLHFLIF